MDRGATSSPRATGDVDRPCSGLSGEEEVKTLPRAGAADGYRAAVEFAGELFDQTVSRRHTLQHCQARVVLRQAHLLVGLEAAARMVGRRFGSDACAPAPDLIG